jgi:hypothetical protein
MAAISTTQRSLDYYSKLGYKCDMVERWVKSPRHPAGGFRQDYLNIIDFLAIKPKETIGVQSCGLDFAAHQQKIFNDYPDNLKLWLQAGNKFHLIGWRKVKKERGKKIEIWKPRILYYELIGIYIREIDPNEDYI